MCGKSLTVHFPETVTQDHHPEGEGAWKRPGRGKSERGVCVQVMLLRCKTVGLSLGAVTQYLLQLQELSSLWLVGVGCILQALLSRHILTGCKDANVGYI